MPRIALGRRPYTLTDPGLLLTELAAIRQRGGPLTTMYLNAFCEIVHYPG